MHFRLPLYLIDGRKKRLLVFIAEDLLSASESQQGDKVHRAIGALRQANYRLVRWLGRVLARAYSYYQALEDRIDPMERVVKALVGAGSLEIRFSGNGDEASPERRIRRFLAAQRMKHTVWLAIDGVLTIGVIALTPFLAPIPGPNVFLYYPALRLMSHYRAWLGASAAMNARWEFAPVAALGDLERVLQSASVDHASVREAAGRLNVRGLEKFLERMT